jgi:hypothetical protein
VVSRRRKTTPQYFITLAAFKDATYFEYFAFFAAQAFYSMGCVALLTSSIIPALLSERSIPVISYLRSTQKEARVPVPHASQESK